jgi:inorganic pyrophosphatase/exopolyphosphatase
MKPILVTAYVSPDLDGYAGAFAYAELLNKQGRLAEVGIVGEPHDEAQFLITQYKLETAKTILNSDDYDEIILVDASTVDGLENKIEPTKVVEIVDHRKNNELEKFPNAKAQIEMVGAAATLIAEKFMNSEVPISFSSCVLLYGAIISNTLNFKATVTTDSDIAASKWLNKIGGFHQNFGKDMFIAKSELSGEKLNKRMDTEFASFDLAEKKIGIVQIEIIGAKDLLNNRLPEIIERLNELKQKYNLDYIFQSTVGLEEGKNYFVAEDFYIKKCLEDIFSIKFNGSIAEKEKFIMRKQLVPILKEYLETKF